MSGDITLAQDGTARFLRVAPIFGLMIYYLGGLITSLDVENVAIFLLIFVLLSVPLVIGIVIRHKVIVLLGALFVMIASAGPIMEFILTLGEGAISFSLLGGILIIVAMIFHIITIYLWVKYAN